MKFKKTLLLSLLVIAFSASGYSKDKENSYIKFISTYKYMTEFMMTHLQFNGNVSKIEEVSYHYCENSDTTHLSINFDNDNKPLSMKWENSSCSWVYNSKGLLSQLKFSDESTYSYPQNMIFEYQYDNKKNVIRRETYCRGGYNNSPKDKQWHLWAIDTFMYNSKNQLISITSFPILPKEKVSMTFSYDKDGTLKECNIPTLKIFFDKTGEKIEREESGSGNLTFVYDKFGNPTLITNGESEMGGIIREDNYDLQDMEGENVRKCNKEDFVEKFILQCKAKEAKTTEKCRYVAYEYDAQGNWTKSATYINGNVNVTNRTIIYSKK